MGLHERAWSGLNLLVYGKTPLLPMKLEQAMASAMPANEVKLDSFENYDDALEFCREKRTIGFVFMLEDCGQLPVHDVFHQLARSYESKGWPCFGVLLHEKGESFVGLRTLQRCPNLLDYYGVDSLLDKTKTADTLRQIWGKFSKAFEKTVIPAPLQETFLSLAVESISEDSIHFIDRVSALISSQLNVSWIESTALRWHSVIKAIESKHASALLPHQTLTQICNLAKSSNDVKTAAEIFKSKDSLCARVAALSVHLDQKRLSGELEKELILIASQSKPGAPALIRHTASYKDRIIKISTEQHDTKLESVG